MPNHETLLQGLGRRVRALRGDRSWTRRTLSNRSGLSERYLANLELGVGNISILRLAEVASALGVALRELLPEQEDEGLGVIALLGLRGAGKSTVGRALAHALELPFQELDALIEAEAGLSLEEVFDFHGEVYYRRLERDALERFLRESGPAILATGGGIVTSQGTFTRLLDETRTVWLEASPEDHWNRVVAQGDRRPMADNPQAMAELRSLLAARHRLYAKATYTVDTSALSEAATVDDILSWVRAA